MELSGNSYERTVTVGNSGGRAFTGSHGDGTLTTTTSYEGNATNTDWPGLNSTTSRGITGGSGSTAGSGFRGGQVGNVGGNVLRTSDRGFAALNTNGGLYYDSYRNVVGYVGRGCRTASA
jgi:hypothetical protein